MEENIYELLRRYEFNRTEPETLKGLVEEAVKKGEEARREQEQLRQISRDILGELNQAGFIADVDLGGMEEITGQCAAGVDGSFQPVGGVGGKWYVPMSCALVSFPKGIQDAPVVEVDSHIEVIQEEQHRSIHAMSSEKMLQVETKAILRWAMRNEVSTLFIDGPIVDPPLCDQNDYVEYRCKAIKECLKRNITVVGCVKRAKDVHLKGYLQSKVLQQPNQQSRLKRFPTDLQLVAFLFAHCWRQGGRQEKGIYSRPVDVSGATQVYRLYRDHGVRIFSTFVQKNVGQQILRLDLPFAEAMLSDEKDLSRHCTEAVRRTFAWSYPQHNIPLPIFIAHSKCEIRKGCAEVLYQEILTSTRTTEPIDQIVALQLEARL